MSIVYYFSITISSAFHSIVIIFIAQSFNTFVFNSFRFCVLGEQILNYLELLYSLTCSPKLEYLFDLNLFI